MGSRVNVCSVQMLNNPSTFSAEFKLEITFEVFEHLPHDLEWELVYVGSGGQTEYDQILDSVLVGPMAEGKHKFEFTAAAPDAEKIPQQDIVGVTVMLLKCRYNAQEFLNLGWFVSNEYVDEELRENPPNKPLLEKLVRTVQTDDLRVTSFPIKWDDAATAEMPPMEDAEEEIVDEADLMPLEDNAEDNDDEEEEEEDNVGDDVVDLDQSLEKDGEAVQEDGDDQMDEGNDVNMGENGDAEPDTTAVEEKVAAVKEGDALGDVTNGKSTTV